MKVAILGYGVEGQAALRYWRERGAEITVFDENPDSVKSLHSDIKKVTGKNCFEKAKGFDLIMRAPAISPRKIVDKSAKISSGTNIFLEKCPAPIIGVTGTKGKGTVSSLIFEILKQAGVRVHLAGNIGVPMLDILPDVRASDVVVLELSSFQLWDAQRSPHVAVILMIESEHLDIHHSLKDYLNAKANIVNHQKPDDGVIYHPTNPYVRDIAKKAKGKKLRYGVEPAAHIEDGVFVIDDQKLCSASDLLLPGDHNIENACAAITAAWQYTHQTSAFCEALRSFKGLPHRLKFVEEIKGVKYYDDSIATTPGSAIAAIEAFKDPKIIILGGSSKGADFTKLAIKFARANVKKVFLIGDEADNIAKSLKAKKFKDYEILGSKISMNEVVKKAQKTAKKGDVVILSPACASFGMFKNYSERGDKFISAVKSLT